MSHVFITPFNFLLCISFILLNVLFKCAHWLVALSSKWQGTGLSQISLVYCSFL